MRALFADLPEACDNTITIARRCAYMPPARKPILPAFPTTKGRSEEEELRAQAKEGLKARLAKDKVDDPKVYAERLDFELDVIIKMGFAGYFSDRFGFYQMVEAKRYRGGAGGAVRARGLWSRGCC